MTQPGRYHHGDLHAALLREAAVLLREQGVDIIIAVTHVGYQMDQRLAAEVSGLDAVVGGHSNTYLSASDPDRDGAYPTVVTGPDGAFVPVVQAYAYSKYVGHLELTFNDAGEVTAATGEPIVMDGAVREDEGTKARISEAAKPLEEIRNKVVASTGAAIDGSRENCRAKECEMGCRTCIDRKRNGLSIRFAGSGSGALSHRRLASSAGSTPGSSRLPGLVKMVCDDPR